MPITAPCTHCGRLYNLGDKFAGQRVTCKDCGQAFHVPANRPDPADPLASLMEAELAALPLSNSGSSPLARAGRGGGKPLKGAINLKRKGQDIQPGLMRFGISLAVLGLGSYLLPLVGLQWKLLNFLGDSQPWVGGILAAIGALMMLIACKDNLGVGVPSAGGVIGVLAILLILRLVNTGSPAYREARAITDEMLDGLHELVGIFEVVNDQASVLQAQPRIVDLQSRVADLRTRSMTVAGQLTAEENQTLESEFKAPVEAAMKRILEETQRIALLALGARPGGNLAGPGAFPQGGMPGFNGPPGVFGGNPAVDMRQKLLAQYGAQGAATVIVSDVTPGVEAWVFDKLRTATRASGFTASFANGLITASFAPVGDLQAISALIDWGTVTEVDANARAITIAADPARLPPPLKPAVTNPGDADFYARNLEDLTCWDYNHRRDAASRLKDAPPSQLRTEIAAALRTLAEDKDGATRREALAALGVWGGPDDLDVLIDAVADQDYGVREAALDALLVRKDPKSADAAAALLVDHTEKASRLLRDIGPPAEAALLSALNHKDANARREALKVLMEIHTTDIVPILVRLLDDEDIWLKQDAMGFLARTKDARAVEPLCKRLASLQDMHEASKSLQTMGAVAEAGVGEFTKHPEVLVRMEAFQILSVIGTRKSLPLLKQAARRGDFFAQAAAQHALEAVNLRIKNGEENSGGDESGDEDDG